jgi:microcystin degradation protein MlrC
MAMRMFAEGLATETNSFSPLPTRLASCAPRMRDAAHFVAPGAPPTAIDKDER